MCSGLWCCKSCVSPPDTPLSLQAIEGTYIDKKCPFTGNVSIRGRILSGELERLQRNPMGDVGQGTTPCEVSVSCLGPGAANDANLTMVCRARQGPDDTATWLY